MQHFQPLSAPFPNSVLGKVLWLVWLASLAIEEQACSLSSILMPRGDYLLTENPHFALFPPGADLFFGRRTSSLA